MNNTMELALLFMLAFEAKHFVADYLLQFKWMIKDKGSLGRPGGYVHAGLHAFGSVLVYLAFGVPAMLLVLFAIAEFVIHYLLDFAKAHYGDSVSSTERPRTFWAFNGLDQFLHHITYISLTYLVITQAT